MVYTYAKVAGLILFVIGILGGVSWFAPNGMLFGIFMVNPLHNLLHALTGLIFLAVGFSGQWDLARRTVLLFAAFYGLLTVLGFLSPQGIVLGMRMNMADNVLHLTITALSLMFALPVRRYTTLR